MLNSLMSLKIEDEFLSESKLTAKYMEGSGNPIWLWAVGGIETGGSKVDEERGGGGKKQAQAPM